VTGSHCIDEITARHPANQGDGGMTFCRGGEGVAREPHGPQKGYVLRTHGCISSRVHVHRADVDPQGDPDIISHRTK